MAAKVTFVNQNDKSKSFKVSLFGPERNRVKVATVLDVFGARVAIIEDGSVMEADDDGLSMDTFVAGGTCNLSVHPVNFEPQGKPPLNKSKSSLEASEALRQILEEKFLDEKFTDDEIYKLVDAGFTTAGRLAAATKEDLLAVLPGRPGVVAVLLKAFVQPAAPPTGFNPRYKVDEVIGTPSEGINARRNSYFSERSDTIKQLCDLVCVRGALLIGAPPGSGKTSILQLVVHFNGREGMFKKVYYVSLAQIGEKTFDDFFEKKFPGVTISELQSPQSSPDKHPNSNLESSPSLLLVDEGQVAFERNLTLWNLAKDCMNGSVKHLRIIIVSAWGSGIISNNGQPVATPVAFPPESMVGLQPSSVNSVSLRFSTEEATGLWRSWCNKGLDFHGDLASWDGLKDYVLSLTGQQPGLMAHLFDFLIEQGLKNSLAGSMEQMKKAQDLLLSHKFYDSLSRIRSLMAIVKAFRGFASDEISMRLLLRMLLRAEGVSLSDLTGGVREAANFAIKWGQIIMEDDGSLRVPSDLHKLFLYREVYHSNESTIESIADGGLYSFIDRVIERLDPRQLKQSKARNAHGTKVYESQFQNEFYRAARSILPRNSCMSPNVGPLFGATGYLDYYLHPQRWGFELLVDGINLKEHKERFQSPGVYHKLIADEVICDYVILDFWTKPPVRSSPDAKVLHIVFSEGFGKATLHRDGSVPKSLDISGSV